MPSNDDVTWRHWVTRLGVPIILISALLVTLFVPATPTALAVARVLAGVGLVIAFVRVGLDRHRGR